MRKGAVNTKEKNYNFCKVKGSDLKCKGRVGKKMGHSKNKMEVSERKERKEIHR